MRIILLLIAVMLLMTGADARYSPGLEIAEGENITLDEGYLISESPANYSNLLFYRAVGDGVADDTNAIKWALENNTVVTLEPGATYNITAAIDPADWTGKTLSGYGSTITITGDITPISLSDENTTIEGVTFIVPTANTAPVMLFDEDYQSATIRDINFIGSEAGTWEGIRIDGKGYGSHFDNIKFVYPGIGLNLSPNATAWDHATDQHFSNLGFWGAAIAIKINSSFTFGNTFDGINIIHYRDAASIGIDIEYGLKNSFNNVVSWKDESGEFTVIDLGTYSASNTFRDGYVEGAIENDGLGNILDIKGLETTATDSVVTGNIDNKGHRNLARNGGFESWISTDPDFWITPDARTSISNEATDPRSGYYSMNLTGSGATGGVYAINVIPRYSITGDEITLGAWVKARATNADDQTALYLTTPGWNKYSETSKVPADGEWHWVSTSLGMAGVSNDIWIYAYVSTSGSSTDSAIFDDIVVVDGPVAPRYYHPSINADMIRKTGTVTVTAGQTVGTFTHGMGAAPSRVQLTPTTDTGGKRYWISAKNYNTANVTIDSTYGSNIIFDWEGQWSTS